jgi:broad specificity phosphatase PhoE
MSRRTLLQRHAARVVLAALVAVSCRLAVAADENAALAALRQGGHVALMRHAAAPGGAGDPPGFRLDDCSTQRNLSAQGRAEAVAAGERLKRDGVAFSRILSSPWCRCRETGELLAMGPVGTEEAFSNAFVLVDKREALTQRAREVIARWNRNGTLLVVTHGANIAALSGINPAEGEIVVFAPQDSGALKLIGRLPAPKS